MDVWGGLTNSCEKKRSEKQRRKGTLYDYEKMVRPGATQVQKEHYSISALFLFQNNSDKNNVFTVNHNASMDQIWF